MNLLQRLFGHHSQQQSAPSPFFRWPGQSGKEYPYEIHSLDTVFRALPGNFIYAQQTEDGGWVPIYISQTRDMHQRLEGHVSAEDAVANGATHIHVNFSAGGQAARCTEEHDLVLRWQPICNDPVEN
jgi:hypothetical protein